MSCLYRSSEATTKMNWTAANIDAIIANSLEEVTEVVPMPANNTDHPVVPVAQEMQENAEKTSEEVPSSPLEGYPDLSNIKAVKVPHRNMVLEGITHNCANCGQDLTDAVSIQRGIGPICSKKGYKEDPTDPDEMQAMIDLAEYPELVEFLTEHYKPLGIQGLVNGLVRVASLNRPHGAGQRYGNAELFEAICTSINSLGHKRMAALLRNTLAGIFVRKNKDFPGCLSVRVKRMYWKRQWSRDCESKLWNVHYDKKTKSLIIPVHDPADESKVAMSNTRDSDGKLVSNRRVLWKLMTDHYTGLILKKEDGLSVKIERKNA